MSQGISPRVSGSPRAAVLHSIQFMFKAFDIGVDTLVNGSADPFAAIPLRGARFPEAEEQQQITASRGMSFYIETFGCQMNVHDSEKVAGVLLDRGYRAVPTAAEADFMLYNTCSIREKAAQKVFSRLGEWRGVRDKVIGVLGCLAQQEGEEIFERAPWVSLVCGSARPANTTGALALSLQWPLPPSTPHKAHMDAAAQLARAASAGALSRGQRRRKSSAISSKVQNFTPACLER